MTAAREQISRKALLAFATNYNSAPEAIMELVDNPIDYRGDRHLNIDIDVDFNARNPGMQAGRISIRDWGGQGMDLDDLQNWLRWGDGEGHSEADIGQFHVGGKLAAIYLAEKLQVTCRRDGDTRIWHFTDEHWGSRAAFIDNVFIELEQPLTGWVSDLDSDVGFVQVTLSGIKHGHFEPDELRIDLTDAYETLLESGDLSIRLDGEPLNPYILPWMSGVEMRRLERVEVMDGMFVEARVGALNRRDLRSGMSARVQPGLRTDFNGRKISDGETFGINLHGRGRSQRVYGEISITGPRFRPNQNKTGWDLHSAEWMALRRHVEPMIRQVIRDLEKPSGHSTSTASQRGGPAPSRKRHALSFNLSWLNDDGPEAEEARRVNQAAWASRMQPKEWARYLIRRELAREEDSRHSRDPENSDNEDIVQ